MQLSYHEKSEWPVLSWGVKVERNNRQVEIFHGSWVENGQDFFTDGAWDGPFNADSLDDALALMGFAGRIFDSSIVIYTPNHNLERLFLYKTETQVFCSPSLPLTLQFLGKKLDITYPFYIRDFLGFVRTHNNFHEKLRIENNNFLEVISNRNIRISNDLEIEILNKKDSREFVDYTDYKHFLLDSIEKIQENAQSHNRKKTYSLITTLSTGYDSPACSVLAMEKGCKEALTLIQTKYDTFAWEANDDGAPIGAQLGLKVYEVPRSSHLDSDEISEAEFFATGYDGMDVVMSGFENYIENKILVTGVIGDAVWSTSKKLYESDAVLRPDSCGAALTEFRFRVGFIHMPLPFVGLSSAESIHSISNSEEMHPWTLWNDYDRPIPRRILEEKGVERNSFGMNKVGSQSFRFSNRAFKLKKSMTKHSFDDFEEVYKSIIKKRRFYQQWLLVFSNFIFHIIGKINNHIKRRRIDFQLPNLLPEKYRYSPFRSSCFLIWSVPLIQQRYRM